MPPFGFNAPITEGFVAFAIPTLDKQSFHIQRSELTSSMDYKHTKTQQLTNAPTHQLKISSTHQLKNINPQTQNSSTHQLKNINPRTQKTSTHKLKNINPRTQKHQSTNSKNINPQTQNSSTPKITSSSTHKLKNLNYYFYFTTTLYFSCHSSENLGQKVGIQALPSAFHPFPVVYF